MRGFMKKITVITGPMFSFKSGELVRRANIARITGKKVSLWKPSLDTRDGDAISGRDGNLLKANLLDNDLDRDDYIGIFTNADCDLAIIDEAQFFSSQFVYAVKYCAA